MIGGINIEKFENFTYKNYNLLNFKAFVTEDYKESVLHCYSLKNIIWKAIQTNDYSKVLT